MKRCIVTALAFIVLVGACDARGSQGTGQAVEVTDTGRACLLGHEPAGSQRTTYPENVPVEIRVAGFECLSSSCTTDEMASCEATLTGTMVVITARASWKDTSRTSNGCTDDCSSPSATCFTPPLAAGTYTIRYGVNTTSLVVPSMPGMSPCLGDPF
ncbi:MAG: hypothetical protein ACKV2T_15840 [Kofleriaceae bacterium]